MKVTGTKLAGVYIVEPPAFQDGRGTLVKVFLHQTFVEQKIPLNIRESYYSISHKHVIRGMHFQVPPHDHSKLVYVSRGSITDVVLDIRAGSPTYGKYITLELSEDNHRMVFIPVGFAHGFLATQDNSCVVYSQSTMRVSEAEGGIHIDSFGLDWGVAQPILSKRDQAFPTLAEFKTPFTYRPA